MSLYEDISKHEDETHKQYNIIYTLLQKNELIPYYLNHRTLDDGVIIEIPHEEVDEEKVRNLVNTYRKMQWTPRAVTRILQGIHVTAYPASEWGRTSFWGSLSNCSFPDVMKVAQKAIRDSFLGN